jgi:hypothetical protein
MQLRIHEVCALLGHLSTIIALCMPECEVPWRVGRKFRKVVLSLTDKCSSGMQTFTWEAVKGGGEFVRSSRLDWAMLFVFFYYSWEQTSTLQFRGSNWIGSPSGEPTYRDSSFHSRHHGTFKNISYTVFWSKSGKAHSFGFVFICVPILALLFLSFYFIFVACVNFPYSFSQLPVSYRLYLFVSSGLLRFRTLLASRYFKE